MADDKKEAEGAERPDKGAQASKSKKKFIIIICAVILVLFIGGVAGYTLLYADKGKGAEADHKQEKKSKTVLLPMDPFVLNLAEQGRFLKLSMQLELASPEVQQSVTEKSAQLRDAIITLISSKSVDALANPEGKFQLKDELLLRMNQAMGRDVIRNLYFTDFIMQ